MGLALATGAITWLRLIRPELGLMILGISLVLLFTFAVQNIFSYVDKTKFASFASPTTTILVLLVLILSAPLAISSAKQSLEHTLKPSERNAMDWIRHNTDPGETIAATLDEGHVHSSCFKC